jgi:hypothetical protein
MKNLQGEVKSKKKEERRFRISRLVDLAEVYLSKS